MIDKADYTVYY